MSRWLALVLYGAVLALPARATDDALAAVAYRAEVDGTVRIRGTVRVGDDPIEAELHLAHPSAGVVRLSAGSDGRFEGSLPAAGVWSVTVLYPPGDSAARIDAPPLRIPEDALRGAVQEADIQLPDGRVHGIVVGEDGERVPAVVHLVRGGRIAAQQRTNDGQFDLVGLAEGAYQIDGQSATGSTPAPADVRIEENGSVELTLKTQPNVNLSGSVVTPEGLPASGAVIKMSIDGGRSWSSGIADVSGHFERALARDTASVQLIVLTFDYPATVVTAAVTREPLRIQLAANGGVIRFGGRAAMVWTRGVTAPTHVFYFPEPLGRFGGAIYVESGTYTLCPGSRSRKEDCREVVVQPGSTHEVNLQPADAEQGRS